MDTDGELGGYEVLLCATGGIACYKAAELTSRLVQAAAGVTVAMTDAAQRFVAPLTFSTLTGRTTHTGMWEAAKRHSPKHIALTDRADLMIIAPATGNIIGKITAGIADDLVPALAMAATTACPVLLAPAMNSRMWASPVVQGNLNDLIEMGFATVGPGEGWLACGAVGKGRMAEPEEIFDVAKGLLLHKPPKAAR